jgi:hypothetical protein
MIDTRLFDECDVMVTAFTIDTVPADAPGQDFNRMMLVDCCVLLTSSASGSPKLCWHVRIV